MFSLFFYFDLASESAGILTKSESEEESEAESKESSLPETSPRLANCLLDFFQKFIIVSKICSF